MTPGTDGRPVEAQERAAKIPSVGAVVCVSIAQGLYVVFDSPPGPEGPRFIEVTDRERKIAALRAFADFLEQHPDVKMPTESLYALEHVLSREELSA